MLIAYNKVSKFACSLLQRDRNRNSFIFFKKRLVVWFEKTESIVSF